jgi:hypothetical protein
LTGKHTALAYDYLAEADLMDLDELEYNTATACTPWPWPAVGSP